LTYLLQYANNQYIKFREISDAEIEQIIDALIPLKRELGEERELTKETDQP
jgi:hypothetical protein